MKTNITPNRKRLSNDEWDALLGLEAVHAVLLSKKTWPALEKRLKAVKYGSRDKSMITSVLGRLIRTLYNDVPYEQLKSLSNNLKMSELHVGIKTASKYSQRDYGMVLSWEQLNELSKAAQEKCIMCNLDLQQQRKCPLAKVLNELPGEKNDNSGGCGYFGI